MAPLPDFAQQRCYNGRKLTACRRIFTLHSAGKLPSLRPPNSKFITFMSQHRSLKGSSTIAAKRNVLKRFERVELLKKRGQFKPDQKVIGLPKTKPDA